MAKQREKRTKSISSGARTSPMVFYVFGGIFFLAGMGIFLGLTVRPVLKWQAAQGWRDVPCTIVSSQVGAHTSSDGTTYSIDITYRYEWQGRNYTSSRYSFLGGSSSGHSGKKAVVRKYPEGSTRTCYVNPDDPSEAVLTRAFQLSYLIGGFGLIFVVVGGALAAHPRRKKPAGHARSSSATAAWAARKDTVTLKPGTGPVGKLVGVTLAALFWNGIVGVFVWQVLFGEAPFFVGIFLLPFVAIGLLLIAGIGYYILALFNPRVEVRLTPGALPLAGTAEIEWQMQGSPERIGHFRIWLEGREEATYRRGTNTVTEKSMFVRVPVAETNAPSDMRLGRVQVAVPEYTMHSLDAPNNKIKWLLRVHGDIKRWPDVQEDYEITVLPLDG